MKLKSQVNNRLCSLQNALNEQLTSTKFLHPWFSQNHRQNFGTGAARKHSLLSDYQFTIIIFMNKIICSILILFPSCKDRHQYYIGMFQIFKQLGILLFFQSVCGLQVLHIWNMIPRVPHDFSCWLIIRGKQFICHSLLFTKEKKLTKEPIRLLHFSNY